jgi:hypothetical protein
MRYYYRGPDALITASQFVWLGETPLIFTIDSLRGAVLTRRSSKSTWWPAVAVAVLVLIPGYTLFNSLVVRVSLLGVAAAMVSLGVLWSRARRHWELRAALGAREVTIYSTLDETTFNQVTRALKRVLETYPEVRTRRGPVAA